MSTEKIQALYDALTRSFPELSLQLTLFPSGGAMLDVPLRENVHVLEHYPSVGPGYGVSRMETAVFGFEGYENYFDTIEGAEVFLRNLIVLDAQSNKLTPRPFLKRPIRDGNRTSKSQ